MDVNQQLLAALKTLFASYKQLADSGDAGIWRIEDYPEGAQALAAIAAAEAEAKAAANAAVPPAHTVVRVIVYQGSELAVQRQLGRSLADGIRHVSDLSMTIATLPDALVIGCLSEAIAVATQRPRGVAVRNDDVAAAVGADRSGGGSSRG